MIPSFNRGPRALGWAIFWAVLWGPACRENKAPKQDPDVVAWVNREPILRADLERDLSRELRSLSPRTPFTGEEIEPFKTTLLEAAIDQLLLLQAAREKGVKVQDAEVERRILSLTADYGKDGYDALFAEQSLEASELFRQTRDAMVVERLLADHVYARLTIPEDAVRQYFESHPGEFSEPEQVHAAQIVVASLDEAKRVQQMLWNGKKFSDVARLHSLSPEAKVGGDLGVFPKGVMPPKFDEVIFRLSVGQTSEIVETEYGFHLFKLLERKAPVKRELPAVRDRIQKKVLRDLQISAQKSFIEQLRRNAQWSINDLSLQRVGRISNPPPAPH